MKLSSAVLALSLVANATLLAVFSLGGASPASPAAATGVLTQASSVPAVPSLAERWAQLPTGDLAALRDRLRAEGFPAKMIRSILAAQIRERYAAQRKALQVSDTETAFWKPEPFDATKAAALRTLDKAERKELRDLLGADPDSRVVEDLRQQMPGLSLEQIDQIQALRERYDEQRSDIYALSRGSYSALRVPLNALLKAQHAELAALLTAQQLEEYDLRYSENADRMRSNLTAFDPNEAEFRAIFRLQAAYDEAHPATSTLRTQDEMRAQWEDRKKLQQDIAAALGPIRATEYERATNYEYQQSVQLMERLALPVETANDLYSLRKEYEERRIALYKQGLNRDELVQQSKALATEADARISSVFNGNTRAVEAYKANGGGWSRNFVPSPSN